MNDHYLCITSLKKIQLAHFRDQLIPSYHRVLTLSVMLEKRELISFLKVLRKSDGEELDA